MARRTLVAHELRFREKFARENPVIYRPYDLMGDNLLDIFLHWSSTVDPEWLRDGGINIWLDILEAKRYSQHVVLANLDIGRWGEDGKLLDTKNGSQVASIKANQATTASTRVALFVPPCGDVALFFSEGSDRGCGGQRLLPRFAAYWSLKSSEITMRRERVIETEAFLEGARVTEIEVRSYAAPSDVADSVNESFGYVSHTAHTKKRGKGLPFELVRRFEDTPALAGRYVGIDETNVDGQEVRVTVKAGGKSKKIVIGDPNSGFYYREVLNEANEDVLSDLDFIERCTNKASDCLDRLGLEWQSEWSAPL